MFNQKIANKKQNESGTTSILVMLLLLCAAVSCTVYIYNRANAKKQDQKASISYKPSPHKDVKRPTLAKGPELTEGAVLAARKKRVTTPTPAPTTPTVASKKWGAYNGWEVKDFQEIESTTGHKTNYVATFTHWGNENAFPIDLATWAKSNNKTLVIYWEAKDYNVASYNDSRFSYDSILAGTWDKYIASFAASAKSFGGSVILIPFEEMNGDWSPWSGTLNGNSPDKHINAYRYIKNKFSGVTNVKFGWTVNNVSVPDSSANAIEKYYPGDAYVDYVGVDGFNFNDPWLSYSQVFDTALAKLEKYNKPIIIFSMASAEGTKKAAWVSDALTKINQRSSIVGWIWFNENKERDWRMWSDTNTLQMFKQLLP